MFQLDLEKKEEPEIKLPISAGSKKSKGIPEKNIYLCFLDYVKAFDSVDHNKKKILRDGKTRPPSLPPYRISRTMFPSAGHVGKHCGSWTPSPGVGTWRYHPPQVPREGQEAS